jgi:hypothetical protein
MQLMRQVHDEFICLFNLDYFLKPVGKASGLPKWQMES